MSLMHISLSAIVGFVLGIAVAFVVLTKFSAKHKIQDELTRSKRELANAKRLLDEFFVNSSELFSQMTNSYAAFADYMSQSAQRLSPDNQDLYSLDFKSAQKGKNSADKQSLKESLKALQEQVSDITESLEAEDKKADALEPDKKEKSAAAEVKEKSEESSEPEVKVKEKVKENADASSSPAEDAPVKADMAKAKAAEEDPAKPAKVKAAREESAAAKEIPSADEDLPQPPKDFAESKEPAKI